MILTWALVQVERGLVGTSHYTHTVLAAALTRSIRTTRLFARLGIYTNVPCSEGTAEIVGISIELGVTALLFGIGADISLVFAAYSSVGACANYAAFAGLNTLTSSVVAKFADGCTAGGRLAWYLADAVVGAHCATNALILGAVVAGVAAEALVVFTRYWYRGSILFREKYYERYDGYNKRDSDPEEGVLNELLQVDIYHLLQAC